MWPEARSWGGVWGVGRLCFGGGGWVTMDGGRGRDGIRVENGACVLGERVGKSCGCEER